MARTLPTARGQAVNQDAHEVHHATHGVEHHHVEEAFHYHIGTHQATSHDPTGVHMPTVTLEKDDAPATKEIITGVELHSDWTDITPKSRHGQPQTRYPEANDHVTLLHCLVVEHDPVTLKDWARLEFMHLDELPDTHHRHEVYSACISRDINQIILVQESEERQVTQKILFLDDHSMWTEPQVNAVILLMHAHLAPGGMKAGLRHDEGLKNAEKFADHYCRTVGLQRSELPTLHSSGTPYRVSRAQIETIMNKDAVRTHHGKGVIPPNYNRVLYRQDSQTPLKLHPETGNHQEHGGVESTVVVTPDGLTKALSQIIAPEDIHCGSEEVDQKKTQKVTKKMDKQNRKEAKKADKEKKKADNPNFLHKYISHSPKAAPATSHDVSIVKVPNHAPLVVDSHHHADQHTTENYWTTEQTMKVSPIQI